MEGVIITTMSAESQLTALGITLPPAPPKGGIYKPVVIVGHGPYLADGGMIRGRVGDDLDLAQGNAAARQTGLALLATLRKELGSLDRVKRVVKLLGMVNSTPEFADHPKVINGCSELFAQIWGEDAGIGARSAVGMGSLPGNIAVEIEGIFEVDV
jgi:enamine deaminase RidA (YjgF/YER057c/UK114 family)